MFRNVNANLSLIRKGQVIGVEDRSTEQCKKQQEGSQGQQKSTAGYRCEVLYLFCFRKKAISSCEWLNSNCIVVILQRVASFAVKHLDSDIERSRRDKIQIS